MHLLLMLYNYIHFNYSYHALNNMLWLTITQVISACNLIPIGILRDVLAYHH